MGYVNRNSELPHEDSTDEWMCSYADLMQLLLCFFVLMFSFSEVKSEDLQIVKKSLKKSFSLDSGKSAEPTDVASVTEKQAKAFQSLAMLMGVNPSSAKTMATLDKAAAEMADFESMAAVMASQLDESSFKSMKKYLVGNFDKERNFVLALPNSFLFESGSTSLSKEASLQLEKIGSVLRGYKDLVEITVTGHTDSQPPTGNSTFKSNFELSAIRAARVGDVLIESGLNPSILSISGKGSFQPVAPEIDKIGNRILENMEKNRRVEIHIKKIKRK